MNLRDPLVALVLSGALLAQPGGDRSKVTLDPQLQRAAVNYELSQWPQGALRNGLGLGTVEIDGLRRGAIDHAPDSPIVCRYADLTGKDVVAVEMYVADDVGGAHAALLMWLAMVSREKAVPTAASQGVAVGDIGFIGWSAPPRIAWIAFCRGNIAIRVNCLDPRLDPHPEMPRIVAALDAAIVRGSPLPKGAPVPKPRIARFAAERAACRAGDKVALLLDCMGEDRGGIVEFVVGGPGQGYVEQDASGLHVLHTTAAGAIELQVLVTGSLGTRSIATTRVDVAPER